MRTENENIDVLSDLLCSPHEHTCEGLDELYELIDQEVRRNQTSGRTLLPQQDRMKQRHPRSRRKRVASYLTETLFNELTTAKATLREALPEVGKLNMTKSSIMKYAIERILGEFDVMGLESPLVQQIISKSKECRQLQPMPIVD